MDPDPGGPKTYGSYGSGSATLVFSLDIFLENFIMIGQASHNSLGTGTITVAVFTNPHDSVKFLIP